ncbi:MAG: 3-keto-disaccharide hydrolase [Bacteroidota bacterium]
MMNSKRTIYRSGHMAIWSVILLLIAGCTNKSTKQTSEQKLTVTEIPGWTTLFDGQSLNGWEITNFGPQGPVYVSSGSIYLEMGDAITGITYSKEFPTINYEVALEAKRVSGNDFFCGMTFPVNDSFCSLIVGGWSGAIVGLSSIDGLDASENETTLYRGFDSDTWYKIRLRVTPEKIEAWIDDEQVVDFDREGRSLSIRPEVGLSKPFGIASWRTTAALRNIRMKTI